MSVSLATRRARDRTGRRAEILAAALDVFSAHGFAAARLEDVAKAAGVAKGTIYLYFPDKQALFEGLIKENLSPVLLDAGDLLPAFEGSTAALLGVLGEIMVARILAPPASQVLRLMISEGPRFPELAAFHHREVVAPGLALVRQVMARGLERGDIATDAALRQPQMLFAPMVTALVWTSLFGAIAPLDARAFVTDCLAVILRGLGAREDR